MVPYGSVWDFFGTYNLEKNCWVICIACVFKNDIPGITKEMTSKNGHCLWFWSKFLEDPSSATDHYNGSCNDLEFPRGRSKSFAVAGGNLGDWKEAAINQSEQEHFRMLTTDARFLYIQLNVSDMPIYWLHSTRSLSGMVALVHTPTSRASDSYKILPHKHQHYPTRYSSSSNPVSIKRYLVVLIFTPLITNVLCISSYLCVHIIFRLFYWGS